MAESKDEQVERLLQEGLDLYGLDETSEAIIRWERVLDLDPQNAEALDYVRTADRRKVPRPPKQGRSARVVAAALQECRALMGGGDYKGALELLRSIKGPESVSIEFEATVELVRSLLFRSYSERIGDLDSVPVIKSESGALSKFNLPTDAGFLLSVVDGMTTVADLISVSGMDTFEALYILGSLMDAGIVEMHA